MRLPFLFALFFLLLSCGGNGGNQSSGEAESKPIAQPVSKYPEHIGDIDFDATIDDPGFETCQSRIPQYYALGADYRVDNDVLMSHFESVKSDKIQTLTYHTIRFVVNCKGKIGRIRQETMTGNYEAANLEPVVQNELLEKLKAFNQWPTGRDFYQYLTFKIQGGKIMEVLP